MALCHEDDRRDIDAKMAEMEGKISTLERENVMLRQAVKNAAQRKGRGAGVEKVGTALRAGEVPTIQPLRLAADPGFAAADVLSTATHMYTRSNVLCLSHSAHDKKPHVISPALCTGMAASGDR